MNLIIDENVDRNSVDMIELEQKYEKIEVIDGNGRIQKGIEDEDLAKLCKDEKCDLLTDDKRVYAHFLIDDSDVVEIRKHKFSEKSKQAVYLVKFSSSQ